MGNLLLRISLPSRWPPPGARHRAHGFGDQSAYRATSSASSPLRGSANPETRRSDTPTAGFGPRWVGYLEPGAGTTGLRVSGVSGSGNDCDGAGFGVAGIGNANGPGRGALWYISAAATVALRS